MTLNIELLETSFSQVRTSSLEFTDKFYELLFSDYPDVKPLFANTHMEKQGKQLFQSLAFTVDNLHNPDGLSTALKGLGIRHVRYGVLPQHYPMVGGSLLKAFETTLGTAWTPEVQQAWVDAYGVVTQLMLEGADYPPEILNLPDVGN